MDLPPLEFAKSLTAAYRDMLGDALLAGYLHGSGAMGGWKPGRSDVDLLHVVRRSLGDEEIVQLATLTMDAPCPGSGVELSIVRAPVGLPEGPPPFELHLTTGLDSKVVRGAGHPGDEDLVMHYAVCRARGVAVLGGAPGELLPDVPRRRMLAALLSELRWAEDSAPAHYAVLNACRAAAFAGSGAILSKVEGAEWAASRGFYAGNARAALEQQATGTGPELTSGDVRAVLSDAAALLEQALEREPTDP